MNRDRCEFPGCRLPMACVVDTRSLCDKHHDLVLSENDQVALRTRKQLKMPPPAKIGAKAAAVEDWDVRCNYPGCAGFASWYLQGKPVCSWHITADPAQLSSEIRRAGTRALAKPAVEIPESPGAEEQKESVYTKPGEPAVDGADEDSDNNSWEARFARGEFD